MKWLHIFIYLIGQKMWSSVLFFSIKICAKVDLIFLSWWGNCLISYKYSRFQNDIEYIKREEFVICLLIFLLFLYVYMCALWYIISELGRLVNMPTRFSFSDWIIFFICWQDILIFILMYDVFIFCRQIRWFLNVEWLESIKGDRFLFIVFFN